MPQAQQQEILDAAQYENFFRNLAEIVHADNMSADEKKEAVLSMARQGDESDFSNLSEFTSWFTDDDFKS
jgi:hypothetical protein